MRMKCLEEFWKRDILDMEAKYDTGSKISYFGDNDLSLPQLRPSSNNSKNCSGRLRGSKIMRIIFF